MTVAAITDHEVAAVARLPEQHRDKVKFPALIDALAKPANAVDAAMMQLLTERQIDTAVGTQLDAIGKLVGIDRADVDATLSDADYRRYVRAKIWTFKSGGTVEDVIRVMKLVIDDSAATISVLTPRDLGSWVKTDAEFIARIDNVAVADAVAEIAAQYLRDSASAGVRAILETSEDTPAETFGFPKYVTQLLLAASPTDTTIYVYSTSGWPSSGTILIDAGMPEEEDIAYTVVSSNTLSVPAGIANAHTSEAAVQYETAPVASKGFGDEAVSTTGGKFATAKEGS